MENRDLVPRTFGNEMTRLRREMDQLMDRFFDWRPFRAWSGEGEGAWMPSLDVSETDKEVLVNAELPGMDPEDVAVSLNDSLLTIRGERKKEQEEKGESFHRVERHFGSFERVVRLPADVDPGKVDANYKDGVLKIKMQKTKKSTTKKIEIKAG